MPAKTAWAHLPNARHIDAVLADVRKRPEAWTTARSAVQDVRKRPEAWTTARSAVQDAVQGAAWYAARDAAWDAAQGAAWDEARDAARGAVRDAVWDAIRAIIAWDSSADLLDCTPDVLRTMIDLAEPPVCHQAALLLPYAIVRSSDK